MGYRFTRRTAFGNMATLIAGGHVAASQTGAAQNLQRVVPIEELVNVPEFEDVARRSLDNATHSSISGGKRESFDRITFRPLMLVPSTGLDLTTELFDEQMFSPIIVGPIGQQQRFHPEGELAAVRGASAAQVSFVLSSRSSVPIQQVSSESATTLWYQVYEEDDTMVALDLIAQALDVGCSAICITVGRPGPAATPTRPNWPVIDALRRNIDVPVIVKGIMTRTDAEEAAQKGIQGIVISNGGAPGEPAPMEVLPPIANAVGGRLSVLIDGSFRRGSDVVKARALGARAVLIGRPVMWGLAAYGADGVQAVLKMLQTEIARTVTNISRPNLRQVGPDSVKIHSRTNG